MSGSMWPAILGFGASAITLPGTLELALLTAGGVLPAKRPRGNGTLRRMAVVVPAHNEESGIADCVRSLRSCHAPGALVEIVVVADNCSDSTAERAEQAGARVLVRRDLARRGKGYALEFAFDTLLEEHEDLDAVLVVDADTDVETNFLTENERWFAQGSDAVQCRYTVKNPEASQRTQLMNVALLAFNVLRPRGRAAWGLSAGILGNGFGLSRRCLEAVPYSARSVVEDLEHHLHLVRAGFRVDFVDGTCVRGDMPTAEEGAGTQRARWEGGRMRMMKEHAGPLAKELLGGDGRMAEPLLDLLLLPLGTHVGILGATLLIPHRATRTYALVGLGVVAAHVAAALLVGGGTREDVKALARAPAYVAWKASKLPEILKAARADQEWVRTAREP